MCSITPGHAILFLLTTVSTAAGAWVDERVQQLSVPEIRYGDLKQLRVRLAYRSRGLELIKARKAWPQAPEQEAG